MGMSSAARSDSAAVSGAEATRRRIVAAAESLYAERGIDGATLVEIGRAAGQRNRSAVQYHFGDKRSLIDAILDKHTPGIERRRQEMLDPLESESRLPLRSLVEALVLPVAEKLDDPDGGVAFIRLNAHLIGHPDYSLLELNAARANRGRDRLIRLTAKASPDLPRKLRIPRWLLVTGLLFNGLADYARLSARAESAALVPPRALFVSHLIDSIAGVLGSRVSTRTRQLVGRAS